MKHPPILLRPHDSSSFAAGLVFLLWFLGLTLLSAEKFSVVAELEGGFEPLEEDWDFVAQLPTIVGIAEPTRTVRGDGEVRWDWDDVELSEIEEFLAVGALGLPISLRLLGGPDSLPAPTGVVAVADGPSSVRLNWTYSEIEDGNFHFDVFRSGSPSFGDATKVGESIDGQSFDDIEVSPATDYFYWVRAIEVDEGTFGLLSAAAFVRTGLTETLPVVSGLLIQDARSLRPVLSWSPAGPDYDYLVFDHGEEFARVASSRLVLGAGNGIGLEKFRTYSFTVAVVRSDTGKIGPPSEALDLRYVGPPDPPPPFSRPVTVVDGLGHGATGTDPDGVSMTMADLDDDGLLDLVFTDYGRLLWARNRGGAFEAPHLIDEWKSNVGQVRVADMNGDGAPDLVLHVPHRQPGFDQGLYVYDNRNGGEFEEAREWNWQGGRGWSLTDFELADFDEDGDVDILEAVDGETRYSGEASILAGVALKYSLNDGSGQVAMECEFSPIHNAMFCNPLEITLLENIPERGRHPHLLALGHFNADGKPDLLVGSSTRFEGVWDGGKPLYWRGALDVMANLGGGRFQVDPVRSMEEHDMDGIPKDQILLGGLSMLPDGLWVREVAAAPIDRYGGDEVIAAIRGTRPIDLDGEVTWWPYSGLYWWRGDGPVLESNGDFERVQLGYANDVFSFDTGDLDQDGDTDVVALYNTDIGPDKQSEAHLRVEVNDGDGGFFESGSYILDSLSDVWWSSFEAAQVLVSDVDGDGTRDIVLHARNIGTARSDAIRVYFNTGGNPTPYERWIQSGNFGLTLAEQLPGADPDRDGNINRVEFEDDTDPSDRSSVALRLTVDSGEGSVSRAPDRPVYPLGQQVTLTAVAPDGSRFAGWTGDVISPERTLTVTLDRSLSLTTLYSPDVDFNDVVESSGIRWKTGGDAIWSATNSRSVSGGDSLRSGKINHGEASWVEASVSGSGTLRFSWWVSTETEKDEAWLLVDGSRRLGGSGPNVRWFEETLDVETEGSHTFRWEYVRDRGGSGGADAVWIDGIEWDPDGDGQLRPSFETWAANNGVWADARFSRGDSDRNGVPDLLDYALELPAANPRLGLPRLEGGDYTFRLPRQSRPDRVLVIESSVTLLPAGWRTEAVKRGDSAWEVIWSRPVERVLADGAVEVKMPTGRSEREFFRLATRLQAPAE